jgi:PAS domain S-box-containing protein
MEKTTILIAEDEFITGADLRRRLEKAGFMVPAVVDTGKKAIEAAGEIRPDIILMDITLKDAMTGIEAAAVIRREFEIPVIFLTAHSDEATMDHAVLSEPFGYLIKPVDDRALRTAIRMALFKHAMERRLKESEERYRTIAKLVDESIYIVSHDLKILYINQCAAVLIGRTAESVTGRSLQEVLPGPAGTSLVAALNGVVATKKPFRKTSRFDVLEKPVWLDTSLIPFGVGGSGITSVLGISRNITDRVLLAQEMEREGISRIEKNMEQFQVLNDHIRNPLQVIAALATLDNGPGREQILKQVAIIDDIVTQLDKGWVESVKVRSFLLRHYGHGEMARSP